MSKQLSFLSWSPPFMRKFGANAGRIADECFVGARYEESAFRKFRVEELNIAESD